MVNIMYYRTKLQMHTKFVSTYVCIPPFQIKTQYAKDVNAKRARRSWSLENIKSCPRKASGIELNSIYNSSGEIKD